MSETTTPPMPDRAERRRSGAELQRARNAASPAIPARVPWAAVAVFAAVAVALAWLVTLPLWLSGQGLAHPFFQLLAGVMMFAPAVATVAALLVQRPRGFVRMLGLAPLRPVGRTLGVAAATLVAVPLLVLAAMGVGAAFGLLTFDTSFEALAAQFAAIGAEVPAEALPVIAVATMLAIPLNSLVNAVAAFGEEIGWRGWLLPALLPLGTAPALVLSGLLWGVWHTPVILLGYNYGVTDASGVVFMTVTCVLLGVLFGWLRLRTASVWPAVLAHGALNTATPVFLVTLLPIGAPNMQGTILGLTGWLVLAVVIAVLALTGQFRKRPQPGLTLAESAPAVPSP